MLQMGTLRPTAWEGGTLRASVGLPGGPLRPERFGSAWVRVHRGTQTRALSWGLGLHPGLKPSHGGGGHREPAGSWGLHRVVSGSLFLWTRTCI